jgi:hypothetical protein
VVTSLFFTYYDFSYVILRVNKDNEVAILEKERDSIYNTSLMAFLSYTPSNILPVVIEEPLNY